MSYLFERQSDIPDDGVWVIYKWPGGKLDVVFIHWSTEHEFEEKRILSRPFDHHDDAISFLEEFWHIWWRMSLI